MTLCWPPSSGELVQLVSSSRLPLLRELFTPGGARHGAAAGADAPQLSALETARSGADGARDGARARWDGARALVGAQHGAGRGGGRRTTTLASEFVSSLDALVHMLKDTTPHFVRCVKPNKDLVTTDCLLIASDDLIGCLTSSRAADEH